MKKFVSFFRLFNRPLCLFLFMGWGLLITGQLPAQSKTTVMTKNKELVRQGFEKWAAGTGGVFDLLAEDMVWTITGKSPIAKVYTSKAQFIQEAIDPLNRRLAKKIVPTLKGLYADGDMVVALWDGVATAKDGVAYNNTYSWYMEMKAGRIVRVVAFFESTDLTELWSRVPDPQPE